MTNDRPQADDWEEDILDDDSFCSVQDQDDPPDEVCGCEDDRDMYDDD